MDQPNTNNPLDDIFVIMRYPECVIDRVYKNFLSAKARIKELAEKIPECHVSENGHSVLTDNDEFTTLANIEKETLFE